MENVQTEPLLTPKEVGRMIHRQPTTLAKWRSGNGRAPVPLPYVKLDGPNGKGPVLYRLSAVVAFIKAAEITPGQPRPRRRVKKAQAKQ